MEVNKKTELVCFLYPSARGSYGRVDKYGSVVVKHVYDACGKIEKILDGARVDVSADTVHSGNINPIRCRSYYYDAETQLYYLNSRYYDPETGRFINSDKASMLLDCTPLDFNLFGYCRNNPLIYNDDSGQWIQMIFGAVLGAVLNGVSYLFCIVLQSIIESLSQLKKSFSKFYEKVKKQAKKKYKWYKLIAQIAFGAISGALSLSVLNDFVISLVNAGQTLINGLVDGTSLILLVLDIAINFFLDNLVRGKLSVGNEFNTLGKNLIKKLKTKDWGIIKKAIKYYFSQTMTNYKKYFKKTCLSQLKQFILSVLF